MQQSITLEDRNEYLQNIDSLMNNENIHYLKSLIDTQNYSPVVTLDYDKKSVYNDKNN